MMSTTFEPPPPPHEPPPSPPEPVRPQRSRRARSPHSARDERRIDALQALVTEQIGRGAAVSVERVKGAYVVTVFDARGDERLKRDGADKSALLDEVIAHIGESS